jgi:hypothetical protein
MHGRRVCSQHSGDCTRRLPSPCVRPVVCVALAGTKQIAVRRPQRHLEDHFCNSAAADPRYLPTNSLRPRRLKPGPTTNEGED